MALVYSNYLFNRLYGFYHGTNLPLNLPRARDNMVETAKIIKGVFMEFLMQILPNIGGELTREALIELHQLIRINAASVASNIEGERHGHLALTVTVEGYLAQTGYAFVPPYNPDD